MPTETKPKGQSDAQNDAPAPDGANATPDTPEPSESLSEPQSLAAALLEFHRRAPELHKDSRADVPTKSGGSYSYTYLTLDTLLGEVRPILNDVGLVLIQTPTYIVTIAGEPRPALTTKLVHASSGESEEATMLLLAAQNDPQGQGSALTYARRYAAMSILGLAANDDDDAQAAQKATADASKQAQQDARDAAKDRGRRDKIATLVVALDKQTKSEPGTWHALVEQESQRVFGVAYDQLKIDELDDVGKTLKAQLDVKPSEVPEQLNLTIPF